MFLSRSIERQAGQDRKTVVIDGFSKKAELTNIFCAYIHIFFFRVIIFAKYEFCAYLACIYFRECHLKENFACI